MVHQKLITLVAEGSSMYPFIKGGESVSVKTKQKPREGDIIVFLRKDIIIIHRLLKVNRSDVITKGDFNLGFDSPVKKRHIIGVVYFSDYRRFRSLNVLISGFSFFIGKIYTLCKN